MSLRMDLNADVGEGYEHDEALMSIITSCSIACGGHAGDKNSIRTALSLAHAHGVSVGAHPSFPDRENFGRSVSSIQGAELKSVLSNQLLSFKSITDDLSIEVRHIKPHGALYNMASMSDELSKVIIEATLSVFPSTKIFGRPNSAMANACAAAGLAFVPEGFADRTYEKDGQLRDRQKEDAFILDPSLQSQQAIQIATSGTVRTINGDIMPLSVRSICVHGDTPDAVSAAASIKAAFLDNGVSVCAPS